MKFEGVTIVVGATDETNSLVETIDYIIENCDHSDIECILIIIPENATEQCVETINILEKMYPELVQKKVQNRPYIGGAMRDSIDATISSHIMFLSADIPTNLDCIPIMIEKAKVNPDTIIKISRWLEKNSFYNYNKVRKFFNCIAQIFLKILFFSKLTDFTSPVLISPTIIYKKINFDEVNFPCLLEAILIPVRMGCKFEEIPAKCYQRKEGKSKNSFLQTIMYLKTAIRIRFSSDKKLINE